MFIASAGPARAHAVCKASRYDSGGGDVRLTAFWARAIWVGCGRAVGTRKRF